MVADLIFFSGILACHFIFSLMNFLYKKEPFGFNGPQRRPLYDVLELDLAPVPVEYVNRGKFGKASWM